MENIVQKTKVGMIWNIFEKICIQITSFILNIILARLLSPNDYGMIGMLTVFLTFSNVFIDSGLSRALIQKQDRCEEDYSTALYFNIGISIVLYVILYFSAPLIAGFYKTPELIKLQRVFYIYLVLNSLIVVQNSQLQINVNFKKIAIINTVTQLTSGIIGIISAYFGVGVWALVIQSLSKSGLAALLHWGFSKWRPHTGFSLKAFKRLFNFGSKLLLSGLLGTVYNNITSLVIGRIYTPEDLGYFTRAQQFPELTSGTLSSVMQTSTFPLLASLQDKKDNLAFIFKRLINITSMFVFPAMIGLAVLAEPIVFVLLGEKWMATAPLLFWLALSYVFRPINILNMNILNAIGRSDLFLKVDLVKIPLDIILMVITFPIGLKAVVVGRAASSLIYFVINAYLPGKLYGFGPMKQLLSSWHYIVGATLMGVLVYFLNKVIVSAIMSLFICIFSGVFFYVIFLCMIKDAEFIYCLSKIKHKFSGRGHL